MGKIFKRIAIISIGMGMLVAMASPILKVHATQQGEGEYELSLSVDSNSDWVTSFTVNGYDYSADDNYLDADGTYLLTMELHVPNESLRSDTSIRAGGGSGELTIQQAGEPEDLNGTHKKFTYTMSYDAPQNISHLSLNPYSEDHGPQPGHGPEPEGNAEATVTMRGRTTTGVNNHYTRKVFDKKDGVVKTKDFYYRDTYTEASFSINGGQFHQYQPDEAVENENYSATTYYYDYDDEKDHGTVNITIVTLWNWRLVNEKITINGVDYDIEIDYDDQKSYLDHYAGQIVGFTIEDVAKADTYDIRLDAMQEPEDAHTWIGNFLWTADPDQMYEKVCDQDNLDENGEPICEILLDEDGNPIPGHDYIGNSELALIAVEYTIGNDAEGYSTYTCNRDLGTCSWWISDANGEILEGEEVNSCDVEDEDCDIPYLEFDSDERNEYDDGSLVVPSGARITMQVIPNYGYQVMNVNMSDLTTTDEGYGQFTFTVPEGAAYFVAEVVPVEDTVKTSTDVVTSGTIDLGKNQTTLTHGSARLEVEDVELSEDNIAAFEKAADGYEIKNYLNISLYNMTCKGGVTCTGTDEDSWNTRIRDLNEVATITLQLEDGVDGNEIVIVHEKHDGAYEIIPVIYDSETNTITFETSSFSNYAIASRTTVSPETGMFTASEGASANSDDTIVTVMAAIASTAVAGAVVILIAKNRKNKN